MGRMSASLYSTVDYADTDFVACNAPLLAGSWSGPTLEPSRGSTHSWRSALNPARNLSMSSGLGRPSTNPESTQRELRPVNNPFVFSAPCRGYAVHANHSYHIVGYDARKKFRKSVAYPYLRASRSIGRSVTLYYSASYAGMGLGQRGANRASGNRAVGGRLRAARHRKGKPSLFFGREPSCLQRCSPSLTG